MSKALPPRPGLAWHKKAAKHGVNLSPWTGSVALCTFLAVLGCGDNDVPLADPLDALLSSLLWIDGRYWTPYLLLFTLFLAPAEHWLGQIRWLTVGLTAHVAATYISEGLLYLEIQYHQASPGPAKAGLCH